MKPPFDQRLLDGLIKGWLRRDLRGTFRRVCWVGEVPRLPARTPVVLYANHHNYYDVHLLWLAVSVLLRRPATLWMADWDRFPFFAAAGVQPFPPDDMRRRSTTLRRTARRFRQKPDTVLVYFPEGRLHPPEEDVLPFPPGAFARLDRLLPEKLWWPVAVHVTWRSEAHPTALLTAGAPHPAATGDEHARLQALRQRLRATPPPAPARTLLEGRKSTAERWSFSFARRLFERYL